MKEGSKKKTAIKERKKKKNAVMITINFDITVIIMMYEIVIILLS